MYEFPFKLIIYTIKLFFKFQVACFWYRFIDLDTPLLLAEDPVLEGYEGILSITSELDNVSDLVLLLKNYPVPLNIIVT